MSSRKLVVQTARDVCYLTGSVNGAECSWQLVDDGVWQTTAARALDDIYRVELQAVTESGQTHTISTTIYYGLHLIFDRSKADVRRVQELAAKGWPNLTEDEKAEWLAESHKGAYNYTDLNRVGAAVNFVAERLTEWGYPYAPNMRTNWQAQDLFYEADLREYLAAVDELRARLAHYADTPETPAGLAHWREANDIEQIIHDVYELLQRMIEGLPWADVEYCGDYPM